MVPKMDPKMGPIFGLTIRILLKTDSEAQFWVPKVDPKMAPKSAHFFAKNAEKVPKK